MTRSSGEQSPAECGALAKPLSAADVHGLLQGASRCGRLGELLQLLSQVCQPAKSGDNSDGRHAGTVLDPNRTRPLPLLQVQQVVQQLLPWASIPRSVPVAPDGAVYAEAATLALATLAAQLGGSSRNGNDSSQALSAPLLRVLSPAAASVDVLRVLGKGGFGSVCAVRSRLDGRVFALKRVCFRSSVPPWAPLELLQAAEHRTLREARVLASLGDDCPHVVRYHSAWLEADWAALARRVGGGGGRRSGQQGRRRRQQQEQQQRQQQQQVVAGAAKEPVAQGIGAAPPHERQQTAGTSSSGNSSGGHTAPVARQRLKEAAHQTCIVTEVTSGGSDDTRGGGGGVAQRLQRALSNRAAAAWLRTQGPPALPEELAVAVGRSAVAIEELPSSSAETRGPGRPTKSSAGGGADLSGSGGSSSDSDSGSSSSSNRSRSSDTSRSGSGSSSSGGSDSTAELPSCSHCSAFTFGDPSAADNGDLPEGSNSRSSSTSGSELTSSDGSSDTDSGRSSNSSDGSSDSGKGGSDSDLDAIACGGSGPPWALVPRAPTQLASPALCNQLHQAPCRQGRRRRHTSSSDDGGGGPLWPLLMRVAPRRGRRGSRELTSASSWPYILNLSMELVDGPTLLDWMRSATDAGAATARPPAGAAELQLFRQILEGLAFVHARGVIHRDLKPANVLLARSATPGSAAGTAAHSSSAAGSSERSVAGEWCVKLADFGLATVGVASAEDPSSSCNGGNINGSSVSGTAGSSDTSPSSGSNGSAVWASQGREQQGSGQAAMPRTTSTLHTSGVGTASYAAPEQLEVGGCTSAVDLYSAGLILMELFCRFETGMERAAAFAAARARQALPDSLVTAHPAVAALIWRLLDPVPTRRPTARQLLDHSPLLRPTNMAAVSAAAVETTSLGNNQDHHQHPQHPQQQEWQPGRNGMAISTEEAAQQSATGPAADAQCVGGAPCCSGRVEYDGAWHDAPSLLRVLRARDEELAHLRAEVAAMQTRREGGGVS